MPRNRTPPTAAAPAAAPKSLAEALEAGLQTCHDPQVRKWVQRLLAGEAACSPPPCPRDRREGAARALRRRRGR
jgi:hypothetical protein